MLIVPSHESFANLDAFVYRELDSRKEVVTAQQLVTAQQFVRRRNNKGYISKTKRGTKVIFTQ